MKTRRMLFSCVCTLLLIGAFICGFAYKDSAETSRPAALKNVYTAADFAVQYDTGEKIIADAELIVTGTVTDIEAMQLGPSGSVYSKIYFEIQDTFKGVTSGGAITVISEGASIPLADYLESRSEYMKSKLTPEVYEKTLEQAKRTGEYYEHIFCGVENIKMDDTLLLFLTANDEDSILNVAEYQITGSSYYGKFKYDRDNAKAYRETGNSTPNQSLARSGNTVVKSELQFDMDLFTGKVNETPDNSAYLRAKLQEFKKLRGRTQTEMINPDIIY